MLETIIGWDEQIFYWINTGWSGPVLDVIFPFFRERNNWIPLYLLLLVWSLVRFRKYALTFILCAVITAGISDVISSRVVKPQFERLRPCRQENMEVVLRARCGSGFSFTSSHASNHFAVAVFFILTIGRMFRWTRILWLIWAGMIALGQVYVGVHFPIDVLAGAFLGSLIGLAVYRVYLQWKPIPEFLPLSRVRA